MPKPELLFSSSPPALCFSSVLLRDMRQKTVVTYSGAKLVYLSDKRHMQIEGHVCHKRVDVWKHGHTYDCKKYCSLLYYLAESNAWQTFLVKIIAFV